MSETGDRPDDMGEAGDRQDDVGEAENRQDDPDGGEGRPDGVNEAEDRPDDAGGRPAASAAPEGWPVELRGVTESVVTTLGPNERWNVAALGLHPPAAESDSGSDDSEAEERLARVTARTWGNTRTRRNFHRQGGGYVQFTRDPLLFVDAALSVYEVEDPVLDSADAWVEVEAEQVDSGESAGTRWEEWELRSRDAGVAREAVPTTRRGFNAVVEATVAASRLDVDAYDRAELEDRLSYFEEIGRKCGDDRVNRALDRLRDHVGE